MNREDIIRMAQEAGMVKTIDCCAVQNKFCTQDQWKGDLSAFAALVAAAEREACAKVCDLPHGLEDWEIFGGADGRAICNDLAAAIRARSNA